MHPNHPFYFNPKSNSSFLFFTQPAASPYHFSLPFSTPSSPFFLHSQSSLILSKSLVSLTVVVRDCEDSCFFVVLPSPALIFVVILTSLSLSFVAVLTSLSVNPDLLSPGPRRRPHPSTNPLVFALCLFLSLSLSLCLSLFSSPSSTSNSSLSRVKPIEGSARLKNALSRSRAWQNAY